MPTPPTRGTKSKKRTPPATTEPSLCQREDSLSHLMVKNWPETKGSQADKYSRLGLGKIWGFLCAHVTFEAVFRSLIPLAIWHIWCLCFSFLNFFFFLEVKFCLFFQEGRSKRASGTAGRPGGEAAPTSLQPSTRLGTGS